MGEQLTECDHTSIDTCKLRQAAAAAIDEFSDMLEGYGIKIPSADRTGAPNEDVIYGTEYYELEDALTETLEKYFPGQ